MPIESYPRGTRAKTHEQLVRETSGEVKLLQVEELKKKLGVNELVRVHETDYPSENLRGQTILHFNLPLNHSRLEYIVALPRIIENGHFIPREPEKEKTPILSYQSIWKAKVLDFIPHATYEVLPEDLFAVPMIGRARDEEELKELVWKRY